MIYCTFKKLFLMIGLNFESELGTALEGSFVGRALAMKA